MMRITLAAAALATAALAFPAAAAAAPPAFSIGIGAIDMGRDTLSVGANHRGVGLIGVHFSRRQGESSQSHSYTFRRARVRVADDLSSATMRASLGSYGRIDMRFRPRERLRRPSYCRSGAARERRGRWTGTLRFAGGGSIPVVSRRSAPGQLGRDLADCRTSRTGPPPPPRITTVNGFRAHPQVPGGRVVLDVYELSSGPVRIVLSLDEGQVPGGPRISRGIIATLPAGSLRQDAEGKHLTAAVPYVSGGLSFRRLHCGNNYESRVWGDLQTLFLAGGRRQLFEPGGTGMGSDYGPTSCPVEEAERSTS